MFKDRRGEEGRSGTFSTLLGRPSWEVLYGKERKMANENGTFVIVCVVFWFGIDCDFGKEGAKMSTRSQLLKLRKFKVETVLFALVDFGGGKYGENTGMIKLYFFCMAFSFFFFE